MLRYERVFEGVTFIAFWVLLICALWMLFGFYVCDSHNCKPYRTAEQAGPIGSQPHTLSLLQEMGGDGIWPLPYIGASILTSLSLWFVGTPFTMKNFGLVFFTAFVVIYFMFSFFLHHYIGVLEHDITNYVRSQEQDSISPHPETDPAPTSPSTDLDPHGFFCNFTEN